MNSLSKISLIVVGVLVLTVAVCAFIGWIISLLWGWIIPDLFPRLVAEGYIVADISWLTAFGLTLLTSFIIAGVRVSFSHKK